MAPYEVSCRDTKKSTYLFSQLQHYNGLAKDPFLDYLGHFCHIVRQELELHQSIVAKLRPVNLKK